MNDRREFELKNASNANVGIVKIESFAIVETPSFVDYLRSGWGISVCMAIDFTASNGEFSSP
jgi:hypothetical protein